MRKCAAILTVILIFCIAIEIPWAAGWNDSAAVCLEQADIREMIGFCLAGAGFRWGVMLLMIFLAIVFGQSM